MSICLSACLSPLWRCWPTGLKLLSACAGDSDGMVVRLALLSLLAVFKDLLPGYRIRGLSEEEAQVNLCWVLQKTHRLRQLCAFAGGHTHADS